MRIRNKIPKCNKEKNALLLGDGWILIKEPKNIIQSIIFSIPLMIFLGFISIYIINLFSPITLADFGVQQHNFSMTINVVDIFIIIIFIYIHEIIHLIFVPNFLNSDNTFLGLTWFGGYAYTEEIITKERYIFIAAMPFLLISVGSILILGPIGYLTPILKFICIINAVASSVDFLNIILISIQVPNKSKIVMNGELSYYKTT
ncbi:hypothetical protein CPJCM30710_03940 [Clostridium polyendosporum]|uniref:Zincin peptidase n=1 Tax=Clostridium polyendosporum TaxID=69208 RepID=A0A919RZB3_9CLOT|nr:DUF3267 domain-containing protein [Clostridium polyendosporum]GIM27728.1 hypothetical protein CPJCM30710_03940 [Clostridium polyendosporum]